MESQKIYEESLKELSRIRKSISSDRIVSIDFSKLDNESVGEIKNSLAKALSNRASVVYSVITGAK